MGLVRVFTRADGRVSVMHPNPRLRLENETEEAFVSRVCSADAAKDPMLTGRPFVDKDITELPPRKQVEADGKETSLRDAWKVTADIVAVDDAKAAEAGIVVIKGEDK